jgi:hemolysin activation/secretion protein
MRYSRGLDPMGIRFSLDAGVLAESGTYRFARGTTSAYLSFPMPGRLVAALEAGGGTSAGDLPVQRLWYVGGPGTVRGFAPAERVAGEAFWRARAEIGTSRPALRLILFSDAGNAASRGDLGFDPALVSVGAGVSTLDGLIRMDVGRAVRGGRGWSVRLKLDGAI